MENLINVFEEPKKKTFTWDCLGNVKLGRGALGEEMPVLVYRLMQFTLLETASNELGITKTNELFRKAGHLAGLEFAKNVLKLDLDFDGFISHLQETLKEMKVGILRMESFQPETGEIILTVAEDLDCSGLPITNETICVYDEGLISGILDAYTGKQYSVQEVDCWATGSRICRFKGILRN
ncbi:MAG: 4-vinyl reductase [Fibromonadales bacterium]|nr:4-vinyl reductase [Fibromonadales bacterium]